MRLQHPWMYDRLPIKTYSFLFGDSKREFTDWGWDHYKQESVQVYVPLQRRLITTELLLEYFLAAVVSVLAAQIWASMSVRKGGGTA